jgi:hypothetical protein
MENNTEQLEIPVEVYNPNDSYEDSCISPYTGT